MLLQRMPRVRRTIGDVVEEVHDAGQRAEDDEGFNRNERLVRLEQPAAENQAGKEQEVLGPLLGTERSEEESRQTLAEDEKLRTASASLS